MNNNFFPSSNFSNMDLDNTLPNQDNWFNNKDNYVEDILRLNKGKNAKFYVTIPGSKDNTDRIFEGIIENVGKDHVVVSNPTSGESYMILLPYLIFISFLETINYR